MMFHTTRRALVASVVGAAFLSLAPATVQAQTWGSPSGVPTGYPVADTPVPVIHNGYLTVVYNGLYGNNQTYQLFTQLTSLPDTWNYTLTSIFQTSASPGAVSFNGYLSTFPRNNNPSDPPNDYRAIRSTYGYNAATLGFRSSTGLAATVFNNGMGDKVYLFGTDYDGPGASGVRYATSTDGINFSSFSPVSSMTTDRAPAACVYNGLLRVFSIGKDTRTVFMSTLNGSSWTTPTPVGGQSDRQPSVCVYNNLLYLFIRDDNSGYIKYKTCNTSGVWSSYQQVPNIPWTPDGPGAIVYNGAIHLFFKNSSQQLFRVIGI